MAQSPSLMTPGRIWVIVACSILGLIVINVLPREVSTQSQLPAMREDVRQAKIQKAKRLSPSVRKIRKLLKDAKIPLEAADLFSPFWHRKVSAYSGVVPDLTRLKSGSNKLKGVHVADTLVLPEKVELTDDTLIIARQVVFSGRNVVIKGNHDLHFFQSAPPLSTTDGVQARFGNGVLFLKAGYSPAKSVEDAKARGLLVEPQTITINVDGYGREQWLEDQKKKEKQRDLGRRAAHYVAPQQANGVDRTGEGTTGADGSPTTQPGQASMGAEGNCNTHPSGYTGDDGDSPPTAGTGHTGGIGTDGGDAFTLNYKIEQGSGFVALSARGGGGQKGGRGGPGGWAAPGGMGGQGGPGSVCNCPQASGNGGQGGRGGTGGRGGSGGDGGQGGKGGNGGTINLIKPCDFTNYSTNVNAGTRGPGGDPGQYSAGGAAGPGGPGGTAASNPYCATLGGNSLGTGPGGTGGPAGYSDGDAGPAGPENNSNGNVNPTDYGNCGGGGPDYTDIQPSGGFTEYCQPYDWVWIHCEMYADEEEARLMRKYEPTVKANHYIRSLISTAPSWECYEVARWYAGCF